jgi:hypothetical protein
MSLWADASRAPTAFGGLRKGVGHLEAVERIKDETRSRFGLGHDDTILVAESVPALPGFPPHETKVGVLDRRTERAITSRCSSRWRTSPTRTSRPPG